MIVSRRVDFSIYRHSFFGLNGRKYRRGVDRIIAVSDAVRNVLVRDGLDPAQITVVRDAIDVARVRGATPVDVRARVGLGARARIILAVGALVGHKGHRHLVAAIPSLVAAAPEAHVVIAGEGELRHELESLAIRLGVASRLLMPGFIENVAGWFPSADVFVMPSVEEGLGSSVLEAMAAGTPIVATTAGGIPEVVRDGIDGLLVPPGEPAGARAGDRRTPARPLQGARPRDIGRPAGRGRVLDGPDGRPDDRGLSRGPRGARPGVAVAAERSPDATHGARYPTNSGSIFSSRKPSSTARSSRYFTA